MNKLTALLLLALSAVVGAINFKQWKECQPCLDAGYGWCPIRRMCGGFANRKCTGDYRDKSKTPEEVAKEEKDKEEEASRRRLEQVNSPVVEIEGGIKEFDEKLSGFHVSLVKFYAPWCGHCKALAPAFKEAAGILKKENSKAKMINVDVTATANKELGSKYGVKGFPTLKLFRGNEFEEDYSSGRDTHDLTEFLRAAASEASKPKPPMKRVIKFTMAGASKLLKHKVNRQLMVFGSKSVLAEHQEKIDAAGNILGTDGKPNMLILLLNTEDSSLRMVLDRFQVPFGSTGPVYRVADSSSNGGLQALRPKEKHIPSDLTTESLVQLCQHFIDKKFHRVLRSATSLPAVEFIESYIAKELIGSNFVEEVVADEENDSLVFFYMPGCVHCKNLKPIFENIAFYQQEDDAEDMKYFVIDGTKNEVESATVSGYPTLYFYQRGNKNNPILVEARDDKGIREFITNHYTGNDKKEKGEL